MIQNCKSGPAASRPSACWDAIPPFSAEATPARFLSELGKPAFVLTKDVLAALVREKVAAATPTSKSQMAAVQAAKNASATESKLGLTQLSCYLAWSVG